MTDFAGMTDRELNEYIAYARHWTKTDRSKLVWQPPDEAEYPRATLPQWTTDLNAAWRLLVELKNAADTLAHLEPDGLSRAFVTLRTIKHGSKFFRNNSAARAICEAWCWWKERENA